MRLITRFWSRIPSMMRAAFIALLVVALVFSVSGLEASLVVLAPEQCSGGWIRPDLAQAVGKSGDLNRGTSAWLPVDRLGVLTCSGFQAIEEDQILQEIPSEITIVVHAGFEKPSDLELEPSIEVENVPPEPLQVELDSEGEIIQIGDDLVDLEEYTEMESTTGIGENAVISSELASESDGTAEDATQSSDDSFEVTIDADSPIMVDESGNLLSSPVDIVEYAGAAQGDLAGDQPEEGAEPEESSNSSAEVVEEVVPEQQVVPPEGENETAEESPQVEVALPEDVVEAGAPEEQSTETSATGAPENIETEEGESVTWWQRVMGLRAVHAQEANEVLEEVVIQPDGSEEDSIPEDVSGFEVADIASEPGLEVFYTINKQEVSLGTILVSSVGDQEHFSFTLPEGSTWSDIENSSVTIRPLISFDASPVWFVDGIELQFEEEAEVFTYPLGSGEHYEFTDPEFVRVETQSIEQPGGLFVYVDMNQFLIAAGIVTKAPAGPTLPGVLGEVKESLEGTKVGEIFENAGLLPSGESIEESSPGLTGPLPLVDTEETGPEDTLSDIEIPESVQAPGTSSGAPEPGPQLPGGMELPAQETSATSIEPEVLDDTTAPSGPALPGDVVGWWQGVDAGIAEFLEARRVAWLRPDIEKQRFYTGRKHGLVEAAGNLDPQVRSVRVYDTAGNIILESAQVEVDENGVGLFIPEFRNMAPGHYSVEFELELLNRFYAVTEEVVYGVLTLNTDQSVYRVGEQAYLQMAALNEFGHTLCNAPLEVVVQSPGAVIDSYSVLGESINLSGECGADNVTDTPDYQAWHRFDEVGIHTMYLRNASTGDYIERRIKVVDDYAYRTTRRAATRINPFASTYTMNIDLETLVEIPENSVFIERVPRDFDITDTNATRVTVHGNKKLLVWQLGSGVRKFWYTYQSPLVSPFVYVLGEGRMLRDFEESSEEQIYREMRTWQLASDAPGDLTILREATAGDAPDANGDRMEYDTSVVTGSDVTVNLVNGLYRFDVQDKWLIIYNDAYNSSGTADEAEIDAYVTTDDGILNTSRNTCYIARTGGADDCYVGGAAIYAPTAANRRAQTVAIRQDGGSATLARIANNAGVTLLRLDDNWDYLRLNETTGGQTVNSTSFADITWDTQDEYDTTSFTHSTSTSAGEITLDSVGHYLVVVSVGFESTTTGDRAQQMRLTLDDVEIPGAHSTVFIPSDGASTSQIHNASYMGIVETTSADQVLAVEAKCSGDTCGNVDIAANHSGISIAKLPSGVDFIRLSDSTNQAVDGTADTIEWDTEDELDTGSFGHSTSTNTSRIEIDHASGTEDYLFFASFLADRGVSTDTDPLYPHWEWRLDGTTTYQYGSFGRYNNGANGSFTARASGAAGGTAFTALANTSYLELINTEETTGADSNANFQADSFAVHGINLSTLFANNPFTEQIHYRWRAANPNITLNSTTFGATEDTSLASAVAKGDDLRLRFEVANTGGSAESAARTYELEYGLKSTTCEAISTWTDVSTGTAFQMVDDANFTNGAATTALLDNSESYTFVAGEGLDTSDTSGSIGALAAGEYTELEYSFEATTNAADNSTYCFRLYDANNTAELDGYSSYPEVTTEAVDSTELTFEITDTSIGFGQLSSSAARWASGNELGGASEVAAYRIRVSTTATNGYTVDMKGATLTNEYGDTIDAIGGTATTSSPGTEQFGLYVEVESGTGSVTSPYGTTSNYAYDATSVFDQIVSNSSGTGAVESYFNYWLANINELTEAGTYSTDVQFRATANF